MVGLIVAVGLVAAIAGFVYLGRERMGAAGVGLAMLRTIGLGALFLLLLNPTTLRRASGGSPTVLLDASLSMSAAGAAWTRALDTARALAGPDGAILRFGDDVAPFDTLAPSGGASRLAPALRAAMARGGPVWVVTDGEIRDATALPAAWRRTAGFVVLPRDTAPDAALLDATADRRVLAGDSIHLGLEIGTWGALATDTATLVVRRDGRELLRRTVLLPPPPGVARRDLWLPPGTLDAGTHVLELSLEAEGDLEPRDDTRVRLVSVASLPGVVVLAGVADWEGRFLVRELSAVTDAPVRGYARLREDRWLDMRTQQPVTRDAIDRAVREASLVVVRGERRPVPADRPVWRWPAGTGDGRLLDGDWYPTRDVPPSPIGGRLGLVAWDSVPPLTGVIPVAPTAREWVGVSARLGRRGAERAVLLGRDSAGTRQLTTTGLGLWRWALRGGAPWEAYRTVIAAGVDWLLGSEAIARRAALTAPPVTERGVPVPFRWMRGDPPPEALVLQVTGDSSFTDTLRFDAAGEAHVDLLPGTWAWRADGVAGAAGTVIVEPWSSEIPPGAVTVTPAVTPTGLAAFVVGARDRWWLFALVLAALVGEWAWRIRRGLP